MTVAYFEKKITDALPKTNNTHISNETDIYRNDTDIIFSNDSYGEEMLCR